MPPWPASVSDACRPVPGRAHFQREERGNTVDAVASSGAEGTPEPPSESTRLTGSDALRLHLILAGGLAICVSAFIVELMRALGGHSFSWLYVFEWPIFAGFAIYMWWSLLQGHDQAPSSSKRPSPHPPDAPDEDLQAWNLYLQVMEAAEGEPPAPTRGGP
jgi:hypothetical protein